MKKIAFGIIILIVGITISCSTTSKKQTDQDVAAFLADFQTKLNGSDDELLKLFSSDQYKDEILKAVSILRNKDRFVQVQTLFDEAKQYMEDYYALVDVPIDLVGNGRPAERTFVSLRLVPKEGKFLIIGLEGDRLFREFYSMKSEIENADALARRIADVKIYYDKAKELQKNYDSVVWYVNHKNMTYYYAVKGSYNFDSLKTEKPQDFKMGLLDETGKAIVPVEFDLIGNPSMTLEGAVEVRRKGKIGYYSLEGKEIIPAQYDWLVPYQERATVALVKQDSVYGWLDKNYTYHENFPSKNAEQSIKEFSYLTDNTFTFGGKQQDLINILYPLTGEHHRSNDLEEYHGRASGMIVPPSYFVKNGVFPLIDDGYLTYKKDSLVFQFGTDYVEAKSQKPFSISETIGAFISDFKSRYIGGRSEFYASHRIVIVDKNSNVLSSTYMDGDSDFKFRKINDELFESSALYEMGGYGAEMNFPSYAYYRFDGLQLTRLNSNRYFDFTEFIKMDSSYVSGNFITWDYKNQKQGTSNFASEKTLRFIRDEILASNGFIFTDERDKQFKYQTWYKPTTESYDEVYAKASEIDKYNLDFLNKLIGSAPEGKSI